MTKVFIPVSVKDELPPNGQWVFIFVEVLGEMLGKHYDGIWKALYAEGLRNCDPEDTVTHWLKEVELPTEQTIRQEAAKYPQITASGFVVGAKYILNLITPNNNE